MGNYAAVNITMLSPEKYINWKKITVQAVYENTEKAADFVKANLPKECSAKVCHQVAIAVDEIYSNIIKYSEATELQIQVGIYDEMIYLLFADNGIPYNPLENKEPDTKVPIKEREIGGLGLFMVKKMMDYMEYEYQEEKNRFIIGKKFIIGGDK